MCVCVCVCVHVCVWRGVNVKLTISWDLLGGGGDSGSDECTTTIHMTNLVSSNTTPLR